MCKSLIVTYNLVSSSSKLVRDSSDLKSILLIFILLVKLSALSSYLRLIGTFYLIIEVSDFNSVRGLI